MRCDMFISSLSNVCCHHAVVFILWLSAFIHSVVAAVTLTALVGQHQTAKAVKKPGQLATE